MESAERFEEKGNEEATKSKSIKSSTRRTKEKPALSPIEEETDSRDSSQDDTLHYRDIGNYTKTKKYSCDQRVSLRIDYEQVPLDRDEEIPKNTKKHDSPPFLTPRNVSDQDGEYRDSSATTSNDKNSDDDDEEFEDEGDSSAPGESTSGDADYYNEEDYNANDLETLENDDLEIVSRDSKAIENMLASSSSSSRKHQNGRYRRPKSAPSCSFLESSETASHDDKFLEMSSTLDWLKTRIIKSERDIFDLKKQLNLEKIRGRKLTRRYEEDRNVTRESLRIDLELWIKKLNDGLREYLGEWQKRERLRLNEEVSRISDLYSQEILKSLKMSSKEWLTEDKKHLLAIIEKHEKSCRDNEKINSKMIYEKIQRHLENLEKRNRKSYATLCKQMDKWENRFREEIVKIHDEDLKKLHRRINAWYEDESKKSSELRTDRRKSKEGFTDTKRSVSFPAAEESLQVEENLLQLLKNDSSKDSTEEIGKTEVKSQCRELADFSTAFEEIGSCSNVTDRERSKGRSDLDEYRKRIIERSWKDTASKPEVPRVRQTDRTIVRSNRYGKSVRNRYI